MFTYHLFLVGEREQVVDIINRVAAEGKFAIPHNLLCDQLGERFAQRCSNLVS
jgi:hypothetical protein